MSTDVEVGEATHRPAALRRDILLGAAAAIVSMLAAGWKVGAPGSLNGLWGHWDFTGYYAIARALQTHAWITPNSDLGFPWMQDLAHAPTPDYWHLLVIKACVLVFDDPLTALNAFLILGFGAVALAQYALLRVVRIPPYLAAALALSFSLLPWHFDRLRHALLANYSSVAVGLILVIAVLTWNLTLGGPERGRTRDLLIALALALYVGLSGGYYAAFISILALSTLAFQVILGRRGRALIPAVWLAILPAIITQVAAYSYRLLAVTEAPASSALARASEESQWFGGALFTLLRTTQMWSEALPIPGLSLIPTANSPLEADARNSTVGVVAVILAFLIVGIIIMGNGRPTRPRLIASLEYWPWLFMTSVLFFVVGGFGQAFSILLLFQIRSWGRFAIVIMAIAYVILGLALKYWMEHSTRRRAIQWIAVGLILASTALDLGTSPPPFDRAAASDEGQELRQYGEQIDAVLPAGCGVYELPAYLFPEGVPDDGTATYDPMLPYLFSANARWSYGGIKGTKAGDWQFADVTRDVPTLVQQAKAAGFCAIQVDTRAYRDQTSPTKELQSIVGAPVAISSTGRWEMYSISDAATGFTREYVLDPVTLTFGFGFGTPGAGSSRMSAGLTGTDGMLFVTNRGPTIRGTIELEIQAPTCAALVTVSSAADASTATATGDDVTMRLPFTALAGELGAVHVQTDGACPVSIVNPRFIPA